MQLKNKFDKHTIEVIRKSSASLLVKILGMVVGLGVSITLGRKLGVEGLGIINLANRIVGILLVVVMLGMEHVILKEVAIGYSKRNWTHINSIVAASFRINGSLTLFIVFGCLLLIPYAITTVFKEPDLEVPLVIAVCALVPQVISRILASTLNGCKRVWQSNLVNQTLSIWIVGVALLFMHVLDMRLTIVNVAWFYAGGRVVVALTMSVYWIKFRKSQKKDEILYRSLLTASLPLLLVNATSIIAASADTVMLGLISNVKEVGLYSVAARLALLTSFFLQISNSAVSPKLASLFAENKIQEMKVMVHRVTRLLIVLALISVLSFTLLGHQILSIWGNEFKESYYILLVLAIGQFVNISTGPAGYLLIMCGEEKVHGRISIISLFTNICLNGVLIYYWGALGAALATSLTVSIENFLKWFYARKFIGISTIKF